MRWFARIRIGPFPNLWNHGEQAMDINESNLHASIMARPIRRLLGAGCVSKGTAIRLRLPSVFV